MGVENPFGIQSLTYPGENVRRGTSGFLLARGATVGSVAGGIVNVAGGDCLMSAPGSGMSVNTAVGEGVVPGSSSTTQSGYPTRISSSTNTAVAASNPSNPRIDLQCISVNDSAYTGVTNSGTLQVITGTPTSGATLGNLSGAPSLPTSSLLIGYVLVPANATSVITADLGDHRAQLALALSNGKGSASGSIGSPVTLTAAATTKVFDTASLAVGMWLVTMQTYIQAGSGATGELDMTIVADGASATFSGIVNGTVDPVASGILYTLTLTAIATITVAGTVKCQVHNYDASVAASAFATSAQGVPGVTGYTAVQIA